jgi:hypothetical protein
MFDLCRYEAFVIRLTNAMSNKIGSQWPYLEGNGKLSLFGAEISQHQISLELKVSNAAENNLSIKGDVHQIILPGFYTYEFFIFIFFSILLF